MKLEQALAKAGQILDEERAAPTVSYERDVKSSAPKASVELAPLLESLAAWSGSQTLANIRSQRPRPVQENSRLWLFRSVNYNLLQALHSQIAFDSRPDFFKGMLLRRATNACGRLSRQTYHPNWNGFVSELPLLAEFGVRNGGTPIFLDVLPQIQPSPGYAVLLEHIEDMIALNFPLFSDVELDQLALHVSNLRNKFVQQYQQSRAARASHVWCGRSVELTQLFGDLRLRAEGILEGCRKAKYLYLKSSLLEGLNLEINQDREAINSYLTTLGFMPTLARSLDEVERLYHAGGSAFELKAAMGHLRSFLESLHKEILPIVHARFGGMLPRKWGDGLRYLKTNGILSATEEAFAASLFTLISDEAVHPLTAEREYARLFRNVVIEYSLLFLSKLSKLGLKQ